MPYAPQENRKVNLQDKRRIYQEVIDKASQELHAEFLKLVHPMHYKLCRIYLQKLMKN